MGNASGVYTSYGMGNASGTYTSYGMGSASGTYTTVAGKLKDKPQL